MLLCISLILLVLLRKVHGIDKPGKLCCGEYAHANKLDPVHHPEGIRTDNIVKPVIRQSQPPCEHLCCEAVQGGCRRGAVDPAMVGEVHETEAAKQGRHVEEVPARANGRVAEKRDKGRDPEGHPDKAAIAVAHHVVKVKEDFLRERFSEFSVCFHFHDIYFMTCELVRSKIHLKKKTSGIAKCRPRFMGQRYT